MTWFKIHCFEYQFWWSSWWWPPFTFYREWNGWEGECGWFVNYMTVGPLQCKWYS